MINHYLITGHNVEVLATFPGDAIDLTVTSPPYDNARNYKGYSFDFEPLVKELYRVTKPGGVVVWVVNDATVNGNETGTSFRQALFFKEVGFNLNDTMIYAKNNPIPGDCGTRYRQSFEYMFVLSKGKPKTFIPLTTPVKNTGKVDYFRVEKDGRKKYEGGRESPKERRLDNIFFYTIGSSSATDKIASKHPAIFPEQLAEAHITTWSNPGDTVLDCFCGSGTTGKMATKLGRNFIGIDISEEYINEIARPRIELALAEVNHER